MSKNKAIVGYSYKDNLGRRGEGSVYIRDRTEESIESFTNRDPGRTYIIRYIIDLL